MSLICTIHIEPAQDNAWIKVEFTVMAPIERVVIKRLKYAYPIYKNGYGKSSDEIERNLDQIENILSFG